MGQLSIIKKKAGLDSTDWEKFLKFQDNLYILLLKRYFEYTGDYK